MILALVASACATTESSVSRDTPAEALAKARQFDRYSLYYLGRSFSGLPLTAVTPLDAPTFVYGDCEPPEGADGGCAPPVEIQLSPICQRNPFTYTGPGTLPRRLFLARGALAATYDSSGGTDIYTGRTTITIFAHGAFRIKEIIAALRPVQRSAASQRALPAPALPERVVKMLRRIRRLHDRLGGVTEVHRRLGISRAAVRSRLALADVLDSLEPVRATRCRRR